MGWESQVGRLIRRGREIIASECVPFGVGGARSCWPVLGLNHQLVLKPLRGRSAASGGIAVQYGESMAQGA